MESDVQTSPATEAVQTSPTVKIFGVGTAGIRVLDQLIAGGVPADATVAVAAEPGALARSAAGEKLTLETRVLRGLGTGSDPDLGRSLAEEHVTAFKMRCAGASVVFVIAGLGGGTGTGISPVLAQAARETGALVLGFVSLPFTLEGSRRQQQAAGGLAELVEAADGVICLPNQKVFKLIDENLPVADAFRMTNELLADGVRGVWRLLMHPGLIQIQVPDLCALLRNGHTQNAFAMAEAMGATRSREVVDKLLAHPLLEGDVLADAGAVLVSMMGGPDLSLAEVNRVMEQLSGKCPEAQVIMGAAIDESFRERLAITLIAAPKQVEPTAVGRNPARPEELPQQLLDRETTPRPGSRFVPPAPTLPPEQVRQMLARQGRSEGRVRKGQKLRQTQLPLEIVSKGRFDQSQPTIHKGEDLDVPTYIRRGMALN